MMSSAASLAWLLIVWVAGAAFVWWGEHTGTHDPACVTYGTVCAGDLHFMLYYLSAEVLGLALFLRVWRPALLWRRMRSLWQTVLVLVALSYPITMHQAAVQTMHLRWLALIGITALLASRRFPPRAVAA